MCAIAEHDSQKLLCKHSEELATHVETLWSKGKLHKLAHQGRAFAEGRLEGHETCGKVSEPSTKDSKKVIVLAVETRFSGCLHDSNVALCTVSSSSP